MALTGVNDGLRRDVAARLLRSGSMPLVRAIVVRLVGALAGPDEAVSRRAAAGLAELGPAAVTALSWMLTDSLHAAARTGAAMALGEIGKALGPSEGFDVLNVLFVARALLRDEALLPTLSEACLAVVEAFRDELLSDLGRDREGRTEPVC